MASDRSGSERKRRWRTRQREGAHVVSVVLSAEFIECHLGCSAEASSERVADALQDYLDRLAGEVMDPVRLSTRSPVNSKAG